MTTNYHTAVAHGAEATHDVVNAPLSQLDTQITANTVQLVNAGGSMGTIDARLDVALNENGTIKTSAVSITAQSQVSLASAAVAGGDAVRYDEFTVAHTSAGAHATGAISAQAMMLLGDVAAATGDAVRYDEFAVEHTNATGAHRTDVAFITAQAQINLAGAAAAGGDAVRWDEFTHEHDASGNHGTAHTHTLTLTSIPFWRESSVSVAANTDAPAIPTHSKSDANDTVMVVARVQMCKASTDITLESNFYVQNTDASASAFVRLTVGTEVDSDAITFGTAAAHKLAVYLAGLADGLYEVLMEQFWAGAAADNNGGTIVTSDITMQLTKTNA